MSVEFLHAMIRVGDIDAATRFFCDGLGLTEVRRNDYPQGKYTLVFLASPEDVTRSGWNGFHPRVGGLLKRVIGTPPRRGARSWSSAHSATLPAMAKTPSGVAPPERPGSG